MTLALFALTASAGPVPERLGCTVDDACAVHGSHLETYSDLEAERVRTTATTIENLRDEPTTVEVQVDLAGASDSVEVDLRARETATLRFTAAKKRQLPTVLVDAPTGAVQWSHDDAGPSTGGKVCVRNTRGGEPQSFVVQGVDPSGQVHTSDEQTLQAGSSGCFEYVIPGRPPRGLAVDVAYVGPPDPIARAWGGETWTVQVDDRGRARFEELDVAVHIHETWELAGAAEHSWGVERGWRATASCAERSFEGGDDVLGSWRILCGYSVEVFELDGALTVRLTSF